MNSRFFAVVMGSLIFFLARPAQAQVPSLINYQGRVAVGTTNFNGTGKFRFALVNTDGSITYWSNDGTSSGGSQPHECRVADGDQWSLLRPSRGYDRHQHDVRDSGLGF